MIYSKLNSAKLLKEFPFIEGLHLAPGTTVEIKRADEALLKCISETKYSSYDERYFLIYEDKNEYSTELNLLELIAEHGIPNYIVKDSRQENNRDWEEFVTIFKVNPDFISCELAKALKRAEAELTEEIKKASD